MTLSRRKTFAKRMESNKRLTATLPTRKRSDDYIKSSEDSTTASSHDSIFLSSTSLSHRLYPIEGETELESRAMASGHVRRRNWESSAVGTEVDHRMTNNNRILHRQWKWNHTGLWMFALLLIYLMLCNCLVHITVVSGHPESESKGLNLPHKVFRNSKTITSSAPKQFQPTTLRSTTSFLPSDAITTTKRISSLRPTPSVSSSNNGRNKNRNISSGNYNYHNVSLDYNSLNSNANANHYRSSSASAVRRSSSSRRRKNRERESTTMTSIDRPFYTKITGNDAIPKPTYYRDRPLQTKSKKGKSSSSSSTEKYSRTKSKSKRKNKKERKKQNFYEYNEDMSIPAHLGEDYPLMPHTTEKSYQPPKLSLEPFFNFLTSLATASREVIMSKEQHNGHQPTPGTTEQPNDSNRYSEEETEEESINISGSPKKSKKSKKGNYKKKGKTGSKEKYKPLKSSEEIVDDYDPQKDHVSEGPIPIPLPNKIVGSDEIEGNNDDNEDGEGGMVINPVENPGGLHILDVLRTPMIPDFEPLPVPQPVATSPPTPSPPPPPPSPTPTRKAEPFQSNRVTISMTDSGGVVRPGKNAEQGRPPAGRASIYKGQGHVSSAYDNYQGLPNNADREKEKQQRSEPDPLESFHDHDQPTDLQAQESVSHLQMIPPPNAFGSGGLQNHQEEQNDPKPANSQEGKSGGEKTNSLGQPQHGKNDLVSKYPTTFVYHQPAGPMPPGSRLYVSPPATAMPPNPMFGRPPFRIPKLRPNLHSYYDPSYHHFTGAGETQVASDMIGIRLPYGPPHFTPPPHHRILPSAGPPPPRYGNGYGNRPGFMNMMPHRGSHYVGHTLPNGANPLSSPSKETNSYDNMPSQSGTSDYLDVNDNGNNGDSSAIQGDLGVSDMTGSSSETLNQFGGTSADNSVAENSENKKIGIMDSFDLFYKEYKIMTWVAVFFATSLALLTLVVYLYVNNPPTEVVQARQFFAWNDLLKNPQITKFLSNLIVPGKRSDPHPTTEQYLKPLGKGFGAKSGKQRRKQTRSQRDKDKQTKMRRKMIAFATSARPTISSLRSSKKATQSGTATLPGAGTRTSISKQ